MTRGRVAQDTIDHLTDLVVGSDKHTGAQLETDLARSRAGFRHFPMRIFVWESHLDETGLDEAWQ